MIGVLGTVIGRGWLGMAGLAGNLAGSIGAGLVGGSLTGAAGVFFINDTV